PAATGRGHRRRGAGPMSGGPEGITVRAAQGEDARDLLALACAWHGRTEDPRAFLWRYRGWPGARAWVAVAGNGRIEAGCGLLPRRLHHPQRGDVPAGLLVDAAMGFTSEATAAYA